MLNRLYVKFHTLKQTIKLTAYAMNSIFKFNRLAKLPFAAIGISSTMIVMIMAIIASINASNLSVSSTSVLFFLL